MHKNSAAKDNTDSGEVTESLVKFAIETAEQDQGSGCSGEDELRC